MGASHYQRKEEKTRNANLNIMNKGIIDKTALDTWLDKII